mgnify:CR=1 FL=1
MNCPRCNHDIAEGESHDQGPAPDFIKTHRPQRCFELINEGLSFLKIDAKTKDLDQQIDNLTKSTKQDAETIKELTTQLQEKEEQIEARDTELTRAAKELEDLNEAVGKIKKK